MKSFISKHPQIELLLTFLLCMTEGHCCGNLCLVLIKEKFLLLHTWYAERSRKGDSRNGIAITLSRRRLEKIDFSKKMKFLLDRFLHVDNQSLSEYLAHIDIFLAARR